MVERNIAEFDFFLTTRGLPGFGIQISSYKRYLRKVAQDLVEKHQKQVTE
jgi:hypothetical protein